MYLSTRTQRGLFAGVRTAPWSAFARQSFVDGRRFYRPNVRSRHSQSYDDRRANVSAQLRLIDSNRILQSLPCIRCHGAWLWAGSFIASQLPSEPDRGHRLECAKKNVTSSKCGSKRG